MSAKPPTYNRYLIHERIGSGAMGSVFRATDRLTGDTVALKRVLVGAQNTDFEIALAHEFRTLASLRHPYIVSVLDYGFDADRVPFFTMALLEDVVPLVEYGRTLSDEEKTLLLIQTLQALTYLHRRGILHRDLKPANVVVTGGQVKVLDFGLSAPFAQAKGMSGTLEYMAPEVLRGEPASRASDLYSVGIMAYELFSGAYPFDRGSTNHLIRSMTETVPDVSSLSNPFLAMVLSRWLLKDPDDRYGSADDAIMALCAAIQIEPPPETTTIRESFLQAAQFVGREAELNKLQSALRTAQGGNGSVWLIGGESGVGKSRLLDELRITAQVEGVTVLRGQAVEGGALPFQLWRHLIPHLLLQVDASEAEAEVLKEIVPAIDRLMGHAIADAPPLNGQAQQMRLILTLVDLLRRQTEPTLILLEDLQWLRESLEPLKRLMRYVADLPLLIVCTYRDDEQPELPTTLPEAVHLKLERLQAGEVAELTTTMLGMTNQTPEIVHFLTRETEGNVFFLIEVVRSLAEQAGELSRIGQVELPEHVSTGGIQQVVRRRLAKIPDELQPVMALAAVLGRAVNPALLRVHFPEMLVEDWLLIGSNAAVLTIEDNLWRFAHDKLREGVLSDIEADERPDLHRKAATAIEAIYPESNAYQETLLEHWHQAGDPDRELHYLAMVARQLIDVSGQYPRAQALLERGLNPIAEDDPRRVALLNLYAQSYQRQGNHERVQTLARAAGELARKIEDLPGIATSLTNLAHSEFRQGNQSTAEAYYQQSLEIREALGDREGIAANLNDLGSVAFRMALREQARAYYQRGLAIRLEMGQKQGIASSFGNLGLLAMRQGQLDDALDYFRQSLQTFQEIGYRFGIASTLNALGSTAVAQGNIAQAEAYFQQGLALYQEIGEQEGIASTLDNLGRLASRKGDYDAARDYYQQSLAVSRQIGSKFGIAHNLRNLGLVAYEQGDYEQAEPLLREVVALRETTGSQGDKAGSLEELAMTLSKLGKADAGDYYEQALALYEELNMQEEAETCRAELAKLRSS